MKRIKLYLTVLALSAGAWVFVGCQTGDDRYYGRTQDRSGDWVRDPDLTGRSYVRDPELEFRDHDWKASPGMNRDRRLGY